jgi:cell wall-associated NlpC family hydrolase
VSYPVLNAPNPRAAVIEFALAQVGKPYRRRGTGKRGFDCSGLVQAAYREIGVNLPHSSGRIGRGGVPVAQGQWQPGDIIVTRGHVSIYLGAGMMVEAANRRKGVRVTKVRGGRARRY